MSVAVRELWRDRIWTARAWSLVEETPERVVLASRPGSETRVPVGKDGARLRVPAAEWALAESRWESWTPCVTRPGEPWSTLVFFDERGTHLSTYVSFERPLRRTPFGFDTLVDGREVREVRRVRADPPWPTGRKERAPDAGLEPARLPPGWDATPLQTRRLRLTPLAPDDLGEAAAVHEEAAPRELDLSTTTWRERGFGFWTVRDRATGAFAGVFEAHLGGPGVEGIAPHEVEIGWIVDEARRGDGVATEAARAAVADLFGRAGVTHVTALIRPENEPSRRVAAKLGMRLRCAGRARNGDHAEIYELRRDVA